MAVPDFQSCMLPLLEVLADGEERKMRQATEELANRFALSDVDRSELMQSGQQTVFSNRVAWAKTHLKSAGLVDNPIRGRVRISNLGRSVLADHPSELNMRYLRRFPAYLEGVCKRENRSDSLTYCTTACGWRSSAIATCCAR